MGTEEGLAEWRPKEAVFVKYQSEATNPRSLINNRVNAITQDVSGVLWIATHGGISTWNYFSDSFIYYSASNGDFPPATVKARLMRSARKIEGDPIATGAGVLDISAAPADQGLIAGDAQSPTFKLTDANEVYIQDVSQLWGQDWSADDVWIGDAWSMAKNEQVDSSGYFWASGYLWVSGYLWANAATDGGEGVFSNGYLWAAGYFWASSDEIFARGFLWAADYNYAASVDTESDAETLSLGGDY